MLSLLAKLLCNIACFLYPAYASYKALSISPSHSAIADRQVERWLMYWAVVGSWTAVEATAGWMFTWLPFYSVWKALFFLYLALPQSEGSSWIYLNQLAPFFHSHERDIDAFLSSLKSSAATALAGGIGWLWDRIREQLAAFLPPSEAYVADPNRVAQTGPQPPTMADPTSGTVRQVYGFLSHYAAQYVPVAMTALQAAASSASGRPGPSGMTGTVPPRSTSFSHIGSGDPNRRSPETSLRDLRPESYGEPSIPMPVPIPTPSQYPSDPNLRSRAHFYATQGANGGGSGSTVGSNSGSPRNAYSALGVSSARAGGPRFPGARPDFDHPRSASTPTGRPISQRNSEESIQSNKSSLSSNPPGSAGWSGEMSYETIRREDVPEHGDTPPPVPQRPSAGEKRRSSWFGGWSGGAEHEKPKGQ